MEVNINISECVLELAKGWQGTEPEIPSKLRHLSHGCERSHSDVNHTQALEVPVERCPSIARKSKLFFYLEFPSA